MGNSAKAAAEQLHRSDSFKQVVSSLSAKPRKESIGRKMDLEGFVTWAVLRAVAEPDVAETMTASERRRLAGNVKDATTRLWECLTPFVQGDGMRWPFQPVFDRLALEVAIDDEARWRQEGEDVEDITHRTRFAIYHLLMRRLDWLLYAIDEASEWFAETETVIKKPNDPNAKRLYFLRKMTQSFVMEFGTPCRSAVLSLASIYFDCGDLDEAAVSKLAPVVKPKPVEISEEEFDAMVKQMERSIEIFSSRPDANPEKVKELQDNLKKMREKCYKVQPS